MIEFACEKCGRSMRVPDGAAGKKGNCKSCNSELTVPLQETDEFDLTNESLDELLAAPPLISKKRQKKSDEDIASDVVEPPSDTKVAARTKLDLQSPLTLGIAALSFGGLGLLIGWVPLVGLLAFPLCIAGLAMGVFAIVGSARGSSDGLGFAVAGTVLSALSFVMVAGLTLAATSHEVATYYKQVRDNQEIRSVRARAKKNPKLYFSVDFRNQDGKQWRFFDPVMFDREMKFQLQLMLAIRSFHEKPIRGLAGRLTITHVKEGVLFDSVVHYEVDVTNAGYDAFQSSLSPTMILTSNNDICVSRMSKICR